MPGSTAVVDSNSPIPEHFETDEKYLKSNTNRNSKRKKISTTFALINFLKGMIGPGCLALPLAFKQAGLWCAFTVVFIFGIIAALCMIKLVVSAQYLCERYKCGPLDYGQLGQEAFNSHKQLRKFKYVARWIINICLILSQLGILSVYYIFIVDHFKEVVEIIWPQSTIHRNIYFLFTLPALLVLSLVRSLYVLSLFSLIGNVFVFTSLAIILSELVTFKHIPTYSLPAFTSLNGLFLAAGSILYALEGIATVLPLENKMKHPKEMTGYTGVLSTGASLVTIIYAACGFYGYITFGDAVQGSITLNLSNSPLNVAVKAMLLCVVYTSFLIMQYPLIVLIWQLAKRPLRKRNVRRCWIIGLEYCFRFSLVFLVLGLAWLIPNLEQIIPLVGIIAGMLLGLVFPSLIETIVFMQKWWREMALPKLIIIMILNTFYLVLGIFFIVTGIDANIENLKRGVSH
ncbi:unnamed protein product [Cylicocyclus nassatus]|uniref:Amino acid transporter transmembrane domain-containing protein n=1 Tax=Cylicocyclus nassatus TaxID=53992 RepID=A0AA36MFR8_CYLNA|nr:unnamed protein product [Cylicocyclus nassatus]